MNSVREQAHQLIERIHPAWYLPGLQSVLEGALAEGHQVAQQARGQQVQAGQRAQILPAPDKILRAFEADPTQVKVLIVGQDPYPTPGHSVGLAFSAELPAGEPLPKSLKNIYTEYADDLGLPAPTSGDLSPWAGRGVLLLNRVLTVQAGNAGSHRGRGWEAITEAAVRQVAANPHFAAILWGKQAQQLAPLIGAERCVISPHPSPLSAYRGFFGSRPFSRANAILEASGGAPVDWRL